MASLQQRTGDTWQRRIGISAGYAGTRIGCLESMNQSIRLLLISGALTLLAVGGACTVHGGVRATRPVPTANLVAIGGGVYVVENHSSAVFYSDGYYWMQGNRGWYRSSYYDRGWAYVDYGYVPQRVVRIRRPASYVRFRARPGMRVQRASAVDHRRRAAPARAGHRAPARAGYEPRKNTRVRAVRGAPRPAHRVRQPAARRPAAPKAQPARRAPAKRSKRKPADRRYR